MSADHAKVAIRHFQTTVEEKKWERPFCGLERTLDTFISSAWSGTGVTAGESDQRPLSGSSGRRGLAASLTIQTDQNQQRLEFEETFILMEFPHQIDAKGQALILRSVVVPFKENNWMPRLEGFGNMSEVRTAWPSLTKTSIED